MQKVSLTALMRHQLEIARNSTSGRSAHTVYGGHERTLRQTLVALRAGTQLAEHDSPGEATVHVLQGRITLIGANAQWNGSPGDLIILPDSPQSVEAVEDSIFILTVAKLA